MKPKEKLCVGIVNDHTINSDLAVDLVTLALKRANRFHSMVQVANIGLLSRSRNVLVKNFLEQTDTDWLLMIDSDERLPLDAFDKLVALADAASRPIVSALVFAAFFDNDDNLRPVPTIYEMVDGQLHCLDRYPEDQPLQVDATGTGCLLIHRSILQRLRDEAGDNQGPDWAWFADGAIGGRWFGEDLLFCRRLHALGIPMWVHTGAILKHRKEFWLDDRHHKLWLSANQSETAAGPASPGGADGSN